MAKFDTSSGKLNESSSIYDDFKTYEKMRLKDKPFMDRAFLRDAIEKEIGANNIHRALMYLNLYEINHGAEDDQYVKLENRLRVLYHPFMSGEKKPSCYLIDTNLGISFRLISDFKNIHSGERCFILGTGPSLNKADFAYLKNEITFSCNYISLLKNKYDFEPTYYSAEDYFILKNFPERVSDLKTSVMFIPNYRAKMFPSVNNPVYYNLVPDDFIYYNYPFFSVSAERRVWSAANASYINLQLAYYMGFQEVYLLGFDNAYTLPSDIKITGIDFKSPQKDSSHFSDQYFARDKRWHLPDAPRSLMAYKKAFQVYERSGRKLVNLTPVNNLPFIPHEEKWPGPVETTKKTAKREIIPELTVVIPAYNAETTLMNAVNSCLQQLAPVEIIIVNDGSTDHTMELANELASSFPRIKIINQENMGLGGARNTGMTAASTKYVTFLDADDTLDHNFLHEVLARINGEEADVLLFGHKRIVNGKNITKPNAYYPDTTGAEAVQDLLLNHMLNATARIYRTDLLTKNNIKFPERSYHEDILFTVRAYFHAQKTTFAPIQAYNWLENPASITSKIKSAHIASVSERLRQLKDFLKEENLLVRTYPYYLVFAYKMLALLLERIHALDRIDEVEKLLEELDGMIIEHDLDLPSNIKLAENLRSGVASAPLKNMYRYRDLSVKKPNAKV